MKIDGTDRKLLELLQRDANTDIATLAREVNLSKTPVYDRIRRFFREGIIKKYVAVVDQGLLGKSMIVFCSVSLESQKLEGIDQFRQEVQGIKEVVECYLLGGESDFLLKLIVADLQAYHQVASGKLAAIPNVSQIRSSFVLDEVKYDHAIALNDLGD